MHSPAQRIWLNILQKGQLVCLKVKFNKSYMHIKNANLKILKGLFYICEGGMKVT